MLPDRGRVPLGDGDHQGVGQQAHDARAPDPADPLDAAAQLVEVHRQDRLVPLQPGGAQDIGLGVAGGAFHMHGVQPQAEDPQAVIDPVLRRGRNPVEPAAGEQGDDEAEPGDAGGHGERPARPQTHPLSGPDLCRSGSGRAASGARAPAFGGGLGPGPCRRPGATPHYRGHEASSTIHLTRSS